MKINLEQGTECWKSWRREHIGASEIPAILGESPWSTPRELWREKLGFTVRPDNWAMARGRAMESQALAAFNEQYESNCQPCVFESDSAPWASASLDGYDEATGLIVEIKCPGAEDHATAEAGLVPKKYLSQLQYQMWVADQTSAIYCSFRGKKAVCIEVERDDDDLIDRIIPAATRFWTCLQTMTEPAYLEDEHIELLDADLIQASERLRDAMKRLEYDKIEIERLKQFLIDRSDDSNCRVGGMKLTRVNRNGSIDWKKAWANVLALYPDMQVDPEQFRGEQIGFWKLTDELKGGDDA